MRFNAFFASVLIIVASCLFLLYRRFSFGLSNSGQKAGVAVLVLLIGAMVIAPPILYRRTPDYSHDSLFGHLMLGHYLLLGALSFVVVLSFKFTLLEGLWARWWPRAHALAPNPERRQLVAGLINLGILATSGVATAAMHLQVRRGPSVKRVDVPLDGLAPGLEGLTIAQLSDVHIGPTLDGHFLDTLVKEVNQLNPDAVVITGDLVDGSVGQLGHHLTPLKGLRSRHGTFFCSGNHEFYWDEYAWADFLGQLGVKVLENAHQILEHNGAKLMMAGVPDARTHGSNSRPQWAIKSREAVDAKVLLAHQPASCEEAEKAGFDLQLSGHTHAGQFYPWTYVVKWVHPYFEGLYRHGNMWLYVNPGTGYWGPPLRTVRSEITLIRLVRKES